MTKVVPQLISITKAGEILGLGRMQTWRMVRDKRLLAQRYGKGYLVDKNSVLALKALREKEGDGMNVGVRNNRMVTKTYEMEDIECPECKEIFSLQSDIVKERTEEGTEFVCPYCAAKFHFDDDEEDEDEDEEAVVED